MCVIVDQFAGFGMDKGSDQARFIRSLDLVALPSAVPVARLFVGSTLYRWHARLVEPVLEPMAVELVTYSVEASDPSVDWVYADHLDYIVLRLIGYERSVMVELWDTHNNPVDPRALPVTNERASDWGLQPAPRGRVIWAEVELFPESSNTLPCRQRRPVPHPRKSGSLEQTRYDLDLLQRVRDGIEGV